MVRSGWKDSWRSLSTIHNTDRLWYSYSKRFARFQRKLLRLYQRPWIVQGVLGGR
jgi:hypothetical protein